MKILRAFPTSHAHSVYALHTYTVHTNQIASSAIKLTLCIQFIVRKYQTKQQTYVVFNEQRNVNNSKTLFVL